jgi:hypothetical protein
MVTEVRAVHPSNAEFSMLVTPEGKVAVPDASMP